MSSRADRISFQPERAQPELKPKMQPAQARAARTYEEILVATAQLLEEVGFERLSTNLVCERADVSPPALYRYFPNKYALLHELGQRLMQRQNALISQWVTPETFAGSPEQMEQTLSGLLMATYKLTAETTGGKWIMRALRAVPVLQEVRLESHRETAVSVAQLQADAFPDIALDQLLLLNSVAIDLSYATLEMLFDQPALESSSVTAIAAAMISSYFTRLR